MADKYFSVGLEFKDYFINRPCYLDANKEPEPNTYTVCKMHSDNKSHFVIAYFWWNPKESNWEFKSMGVRYIQEHEPGLNDWIIKCMNVLECNIQDQEVTSFND